MFMRTGPSPQADRMMNWLFDGIYEAQVELIANGRKLERWQVRELIDHGPYTAETAKAAGLIDAIEHRQDFEKVLREKYGKDVVFNRKYGQKKPPQIDLGSPFGLMKFMSEMMGGAKPAKSTKPSVAIVYVEGPIVPGEGGGFNPLAMGGAVAASSPVRRALEKAALDDTVKAVVLRVSSPGGSAVASEIILDATRRVKARKPFVVSMGDVAGSGGYYVSLGADTIYADESTITASIGVVAGKFATNDMWAKAGITFKGYARGKNAGLLGSDKPFTPEERQKLQAWMDSIYGTFKGHVTASRGNKLKKPLDDIAGGRVYTGKQALELGLIDKIGSLRDALEQAAGEARLKPGEYEVRTIPEAKNPLQALLDELTGGASQEEPNGLAFLDAPNATGLSLRASPGLLEMAAPHLQQLDPARVRTIRAALLRLEMLQSEGALLTMPEIIIAP
jgi:protease-4